MSVKRINIQSRLEWQPGEEIESDEFGVWRIKSPAHVPTETAVKVVPKPLSRHPQFSFALRTKCEFVATAGAITEFNIHYVGLNAKESIHYGEVVPGVSDEPIETHPRYINLTQDEHKYIADYLQNPKGIVTVQDLSSLGLELLAKKLKGVESYRSQNITLRDTYYTQKEFTAIRPVQIVAHPPGAPSVPLNYNWLLTPGEQTQEGGCYKVVDEYLLSGPLGWDATFYLT